MPHLVEILLPLTPNRRNRANADLVRDELTEKFGGVTLLVNSRRKESGKMMARPSGTGSWSLR